MAGGCVPGPGNAPNDQVASYIYAQQVAIVTTGSDIPFCGGSIISNRHVLTAAHCTYNKKTDGARRASRIEVLVGEHDVEDDIPALGRFSVSSILNYPKFDPKTLRNDISILTLTSTIIFSNKVSPICLPASPPDIYAEYPSFSGKR